MITPEYHEAKSALHRADTTDVLTPVDQVIIDAMWELLKYTRAVEQKLRDVMDHNKLGDGS